MTGGTHTISQFRNRYSPPSVELQKLVNKLREVLKSHGYLVAANSDEFDRMSAEMLRDVLNSWEIWDRQKLYMNV